MNKKMIYIVFIINIYLAIIFTLLLMYIKSQWDVWGDIKKEVRDNHLEIKNKLESMRRSYYWTRKR
jgi:hypothetical protein